MSSEIENSTVQHTGPHVPGMQGEEVFGPITNTVITTFIFLIIILIISVKAKLSLKNSKSKLKEFFINFVGFLDSHLSDSFGDKKFSRKFLPLIGGIFIIIFFGNIFGLMIDWVGSSINSDILHYLRPMHSDLNTTIVLGLTTVLVFLGISIKYIGSIKTAKGYFFNYTGYTIGEKIINVFVGWLHLIGIPATVASLSLRLFGNIFAGIVLIGVITFLGSLMTSNIGLSETGKLLSLPFWFFELFVAFIQAAVFAGLMIAYFGQSKENSH